VPVLDWTDARAALAGVLGMPTEDVRGLVIAWLAGSVWVGMILYCLGIALGICRPLNQL
jgi:hypothetical protein